MSLKTLWTVFENTVLSVYVSANIVLAVDVSENNVQSAEISENIIVYISNDISENILLSVDISENIIRVDVCENIIYYVNISKNIEYCDWEHYTICWSLWEFLLYNPTKSNEVSCLFPNTTTTMAHKIHQPQSIKKGKRNFQGGPQSQTAAVPRHQEEEETAKSKPAQIDQTYEKQ